MYIKINKDKNININNIKNNLVDVSMVLELINNDYENCSIIEMEKYKTFKFPTIYQSQIHMTKYSRWNDEINRRETWPETVKRFMDWFVYQAKNHNLDISEELQINIYESILNLKIMPSMRTLMTAGKALVLDNASGYNCAFLCIDNIRSFSELMYVLAVGAGAGFSVERQYINNLPDLPSSLLETEHVIIVEDTRIGWCDSLKELINSLYKGEIPKWNTSQVRAAGTRLKTFGGRASGPQVLENLFKYIVNIFKHSVDNNNRKLTSIDCHSICCKIADCIISGGVRRSAMISLSNLSDIRMRNAKSGEWWTQNSHFSLSNNSAVYDEKPNAETFMEEWTSLIKSKSGERGIFNRQAAQAKAAENGRRKSNLVIGTNP